MEITEIRIKLMEGSEDRLRAFCSITIDNAFVVRDLKIIDGTNGPFVAMPSRKLTGHCRKCNHKNHLRACFCNHCGAKQSGDGENNYDSPQKLYADVAHPINSECREMIQGAVLEGFEAELARAAQPNYRSRYDDDFGDSETADPTVVSKDDRKTERPSESPNVPAPSAAKKEGGPPRPHFLDGPSGPSRQSVGRETDGDDGSFGAGIF